MSSPASASSSKKPSGRVDHEVAVQGAVGDGPQRGDHHRAERDRGHEVSVHDVDMDDVGMGLDAA